MMPVTLNLKHKTNWLIHHSFTTDEVGLFVSNIKHRKLNMLHKFLASVVVFSTFLVAPLQAADKNSAHNKKAFEIYKTAVEMRTVKGHNMVLKLATYLASELEKGGFSKDDIHVAEVDDNAVLIVRYKGDGSAGKRPISISAHMDVVEADPKDWERDPFTLIEENGYYFGRGTVDDKAGMTAVVANFLRLKSEGWVPSRDLIIAFSGDEETGMLSTRALVTEFKGLIDSEFVLNADAGGGRIFENGSQPASYNLQAAEKTYVDFELTVTNPGGHSSRPREDNAIYDLAGALKNIQAYKFPVVTNALTRAYFKGKGPKTQGDLGKAMSKFANDPTDEWAVNVLRSDATTVGTTGTTCVATMLRGGHAPNALAQSATANVNCRIFPGEGVEATVNTLKKVIANDEITITTISDPVETDASPLRDDILAAVRKAIDTRYPELEIIPSMSSGGTDGMHFRAAGIPSYGVNGIFMKSSDSFSHGLNERLPVKSFYSNIEHWYVLLKAIAD
jgi:acetylornithine deacetylase/succinyl-diaminopimelate desuccinylase-like protein